MHHEPAQLTDGHKILAKLAGNWTGDEKMFPSPWDEKGGTATAKLTSKVVLDGFGVTTDYEQSRGGQVTYRGHGVYAYDPREKTYHMTWFDTMSGGIGGTSKGTFDGKTLAFGNQHAMGHSRYSYTFQGDGKVLFKIEASQDGKAWKPFLEGTYTKA